MVPGGVSDGSDVSGGPDFSDGPDSDVSEVSDGPDTLLPPVMQHLHGIQILQEKLNLYVAHKNDIKNRFLCKICTAHKGRKTSG